MQGPPVLPQQRLLLYSPSEWEEFVLEWAHFCLKKRYVQVVRFGGANDRGIDVAAFADDDRLNGVWDNYQCKHYADPLKPTDIWPELAKVLWYSFQQEFCAPRSYCFVAPRGVGTTLAGYLNNPPKLKQELIKNWDKHCRRAITSTQEIPLEGDFLTYVPQFDFSIFQAKTSLQLIEDHRSCPHHAIRFGGDLPPRPPAETPPAELGAKESRYVAQLLLAYQDHQKRPVTTIEALKEWKPIAHHFRRQREAFYHAESLRVFARDTVPAGTFEALQDDIFDGVIDTHDANHPDGYVRVCKVTQAARELQLTENALLSRTKPRDRDGICHQLANDDRLRWTRQT